MLNRICGDMHLFKKMAAFFLAQQNEGGAVESRRAAAKPANHQGGKKTLGVSRQWSVPVMLKAGTPVVSIDFHSLFSGYWKKGNKILGILCERPLKTNEYPPENWGKFQFDEFSFWNGPFLWGHVSREKSPLAFHCTACLIGILPGSLSWLSIITIYYSCVVFLLPIYPKQPKGLFFCSPSEFHI